MQVDVEQVEDVQVVQQVEVEQVVEVVQVVGLEVKVVGQVVLPYVPQRYQQASAGLELVHVGHHPSVQLVALTLTWQCHLLYLQQAHHHRRCSGLEKPKVGHEKGL